LQNTPVALVLTVVAGFIDAFGYIYLFDIYVAHMSGNTVAAARHLADLQWYGFVRHGWPIVTFIAGLLIGSVMYEAQISHPRLPVASTLLVETLLVGGFIAASSGVRFVPTVPPPPAIRYFLIVAMLTIALGMQNVTLRKVGGLNVYTTFVTGSLVKFGESAASLMFWAHRRTRNRFGARAAKVARVAPRQQHFQHMMLTGGLFVCYLVGAYCGALTGLRYQLKAMFMPLAILVALLLYSTIRPFVQLPEQEW
jgi:uncharacterized membrane protein YoaK (UPF0700 family)